LASDSESGGSGVRISSGGVTAADTILLLRRQAGGVTLTSANDPKRTSDTLFRFDARTRPWRCINDKGIFLELRGLLGRNDRGDLGNKTGSAFESYVAPQPGYGDNETIPKAN